ncbi:hypothetical protein [Megamonas funiformis]|uniref:hypothetical protein n=1 Tax=Megamonas funiformis TaxID=437897 RepID=UPI00356641F8
MLFVTAFIFCTTLVKVKFYCYDEETIEVILEAVKIAGYEPGKDFMIAIDAAASEWKGSKIGEYILPKSGK